MTRSTASALDEDGPGSPAYSGKDAARHDRLLLRPGVMVRVPFYPFLCASLTGTIAGPSAPLRGLHRMLTIQTTKGTDRGFLRLVLRRLFFSATVLFHRYRRLSLLPLPFTPTHRSHLL